jgi:HAD superfamily hydrolase (TIGR01509 family)
VIRALVFDFDGLICDTESALIDAYGAIHADHGIAFNRELFLHSVGHADYAFDPWQGFEKRADRAELEAARKTRNRELDVALPLLPGVLALLDAAQAGGVRLAVASNSRHDHVEGHLARLGIRGRFAVIGCREDVASPKPEPDLYRYVVNQLGIPPHHAIAFEDSRTGSLAAKRAHLWTVAIPNPSTAHHDFSHVDWRVASMLECPLPALLARFS